MEKFIEILRLLSGPVIGAVIGYFTNLIAVKMLFRPYNPVKIGKWQLPLTPGIIPKRQPALARAVGQAVGTNLFTGDDLRNLLLSEQTENIVADAIMEKAGISGGDGQTLDRLLGQLSNEARLSGSKERFSAFLTDKLIDAAEEMDLGAVIAEEGMRAINEKKASLGMLSLVINERMLQPLLDQLGDRVNIYVAENGREKALPAVQGQIEKLSGRPISELLADFDSEKICGVIKSVYAGVVSGFAGELLNRLDIASVVENKVAAMDVKELEELCLSVMKKELNAIVNLGALIGFVLGVLNMFI